MKMDLTNLTSVIFNDVVNETQVCYHLVYPKDFNLVKKSKVITQTNGGISKKRRRRGRPRKEEVKKLDEERRVPDEVATGDKTDENVVHFKSTRYGRVSRPPKHMSKFVDIKDSRVSASTDVSTVQVEPSEMSTNYSAEQQTDLAIAVQKIPEIKKVRKNVDRFTCGACKKVYLGRKKLLRHYLAFPDHKSSIHNHQSNTNGVSTNGTNSFLFDELLKTVGRASESERISIFLTEISNFVNKVQLFKPKLLQTEQGAHLNAEYYVDKNVSKILDLPGGLLRLNDRAFDENVQHNSNAFSTYTEENPMADIPNLPPLGYNLNLFPEVDYDQISDNAVEAVEVLGKPNGNDALNDLSHEAPILDIPLDLFPFNNLNK